MTVRIDSPLAHSAEQGVMNFDYDAVVFGRGLSGSVAALLAAEKG